MHCVRKRWQETAVVSTSTSTLVHWSSIKWCLFGAKCVRPECFLALCAKIFNSIHDLLCAVIIQAAINRSDQSTSHTPSPRYSMFGHE